MSILRRFLHIDFRDLCINPSTQLVMIHLIQKSLDSRHGDDGEDCIFPCSTDWLSMHANLHVRTVIREIKQLETMGFIYVYRESGKANRYSIRDFYIEQLSKAPVCEGDFIDDEVYEDFPPEEFAPLSVSDLVSRGIKIPPKPDEKPSIASLFKPVPVPRKNKKTGKKKRR